MNKKTIVLLALSAAFLLSIISANAAIPNGVTASGNDGNIPENTLDNDPEFSTRWSVNGNDGSQWVRYDFGSSVSLSGLNIAFYKGDQRNTYFQVESSNNGSTWTSLLGTTASSGNTTSNELFSFPISANARYFRIVGYGNSSNTWNSITDVKFIAANTPGNTASVPGLIQAEDYSDYYDTTSGNTGGKHRNDDVDIQSTTDSGDGFNVGWTSVGEWLDYPINVTTAGNYMAEVRVASSKTTGKFSLSVDNVQIGNEVTVRNTGGWQSWTTRTVDLGNLSTGNHTLRLDITGANLNVNWLNLSVNSDLDPNLPPGNNFDLSNWYLSVPTDADNSGTADSIKGDNLRNYSDSNYFYTDGDGGMVFNCPVAGFKTSTSTSYTRVELREMVEGGSNTDTKDLKNNWAFSSNTADYLEQVGAVDGTLRATLAVNHVTTTGQASKRGRVIVGQIHAPKDEPIRLYYHKTPSNELGALYFAHEPERSTGLDEEYVYLYGNSRSSNMPNPTDGIALNEKFSYEIKVVGNMLYVTIMRDGYPDKTEEFNMQNSGYDVEGQYMYFKAGVYNQQSEDYDGEPNDYARATFYSIENTHTTYNLD